MEKIIRAYAKINLHLEVLNLRDDGYHNIFSLMASVEAHDLLKLDKVVLKGKGSDVAVFINCTGGDNRSAVECLPVEKNLIYKAAQNYFKSAGVSAEVFFALEKNLPAGAGLGGGSADAAAALKLLNSELRLIDEKGIMQVASDTGSDVPFCMNEGFAICEGRGEIIENIAGGFSGRVLLVNDGIHVDTAGAYRALERNKEFSKSIEELGRKRAEFKKAIISNNFNNIIEYLINDFEAPAISEHPEIGNIKKEIMGLGAVFSMMTGSGSSVYGIFSDADAAQKASNLLKGRYKNVFLTKFAAQHIG